MKAKLYPIGALGHVRPKRSGIPEGPQGLVAGLPEFIPFLTLNWRRSRPL